MDKNKIIKLIGILLIVIGLLITILSYIKNEKDSKTQLININDYLNKVAVDDVAIDEEEIEENNIITSNKENDPQKELLMVLEIPKINFKRGVYNIKSKYNNVKYNIEILKESDMPNIDNGNLLIAGHNGNSKVSFFNKLNKLSLEDKVYIYYNGTKYIYKVDSIYQIQKDGIAEIYRYSDKNTLTLITCSRKIRDKQEVYVSYLIDEEKY